VADREDRVRELEVELLRVQKERDEFAEEAALLKRTLRASPYAIMCVRGATGRYAFVNPAFAEQLGLNEAEVLAADPYRVFMDGTHPDDVKGERDAIERIARGEVEGFELEKRLVRKNGEERWTHVTAVARRDDEGRLEFLTAYFRDVQAERELTSANERLQNQLRQSQKLEALGKLAGGVAHDFNNRLVIIMGHTEILKRAFPNDATVTHHSDLVLSSCQRAAELTRQLLAYSRRQVLKLEAFDLNQTVARLRELLQRLMGDQIQVVTELKATFPIFSDPGQIEQVILNLAINARDAMPQGGRLLLETDDAHVESDKTQGLAAGHVLLAVRDNGTGIAESVLPHIFEPFFTTKEIGQGTGLGLSMVEGIVHQSGGRVKVETTLAGGTSVLVSLPRAREVATRVHHPVEPLPPPKIEFETVLVCDDDDGVRNLLVDVLGFRAYRILEACNGREALAVANQHRAALHLLITDVVMPELGGVDLAAELRRDRPELPVLYLSGYADHADLLSLPLGERTYFLAKPFLPGELTQLVYSILEKRGAEPGRDAAG
jgi:two-component system cell cycle sensor histidine kinase/response regulator CckA